MIWKRLREEFPVESYWGMDVKPRAGRMTIDSVRVLAQPIAANVIDVDTYGAPWDHWLAMLPNLTESTLIFLTMGSYGGLGQLHKTALRVLGLADIHVPPVIQPRLLALSISACLAQAYSHGKTIMVWEGQHSKNAQYFAAFVEPMAEKSRKKRIPEHNCFDKLRIRSKL